MKCYFCKHKALHIDTYNRELVDLCTHCYSNKRHLSLGERDIRIIDGMEYSQITDTFISRDKTFSIGRLSKEQYPNL